MNNLPGFNTAARTCMLLCLCGLLTLNACRLIVGEERVLTKAVNSGFSMHANFGITTGPKIINIPLSASNETRYLLVENPHINQIELTETKGPLRWITGDHYPFKSRPLNNRFFVFPIPALPVQDTLHLSLNKAGENLSFSLRLFDAKSFESFCRTDDYIMGSVVGFYALAILLSLAMFLYNRSARFFYFFLYVFFSVWWIFNDAGVLFAHWWPDATIWHQSSRGFFSSLTMVLFALYLSKNEDAMIGRGIRSVVKLIVILLGGKWVLSFFVAAGYFPDSLKYAAMYINSVGLLLLFGAVAIFLTARFRALKKNQFEGLSILTYCAFVIFLVSKELGIEIIQVGGLHQMEVLLFFPLQCIFMAAQLNKSVQEKRKEAEQALVQLKMKQQFEIEKTIAEVEETEKKRIAQNLHDEIGGLFVALKYQSLLLKQKLVTGIQPAELEYLTKIADEGIDRHHRIVEELSTSLNQQKGLLASLRLQMEMMSAASGIMMELNFTADESGWSPFQKAQLFRILIEMLTNTVKHAEATAVSLSISGSDLIQVSYEDNGKGFDCHTADNGHGLSNIRERIRLLQGQCDCTSGSKGTIYTIIIPVTHD